ncbi:hypothetical protein N9Z95_05685 [Akkermansiaceae bacterium]|nr:hypothetical protein [Akkermansiaceae bacterium]
MPRPIQLGLRENSKMKKQVLQALNPLAGCPNITPHSAMNPP